MFEKVRNKYLYNKTQIIELDKSGNVINSDNLLYPIPLNSSIANFHPFFETIISLIDLENEEFTFNCIHLDVNAIKKSIDVVFNSGSKKTNPILIFFDFTEHYNNFQSISQEKNESILSFHIEEIKNQQLEAEKNFKNKFLANVSHDLKTPLGASLWFIGMLEKSDVNADQKELLSLLRETTTHVKGLVDDILDLSKIEMGIVKISESKIDFLKLLHQINKTIAPKAKEKNLDFNVNFDATLPKFISVDKLRLTQIIINLLDNAIKFTKIGSVSFAVSVLSKTKNKALISIVVADTGTGIKCNDKNDVYQSFKKLHQSKKMEGSGLGLSIVSQLLEMMNGTIDYESELNKGTVFTIQLPIKTIN
jgi:two-component system, sensor histidine kinase